MRMNDDRQTSQPWREVVAIFHSPEALVAAADALQSNGVDRARLSVLAAGTSEQVAALEKAGFHSVRDLLSDPYVPRTAYVQPEDVATARSALVSTLVYVGATAGAVAASAAAGPLIAPIVAAAAAAGAAGGGVGAFLVHRFGGRAETWVEQGLAHGGLVLWVLLRDDEQRVIELLKKAGGTNVRAQDAPKPWLEPAHQTGAPA
jgi:hypothetical protein